MLTAGLWIRLLPESRQGAGAEDKVRGVLQTTGSGYSRSLTPVEDAPLDVLGTACSLFDAKIVARQM